MSSQYSRDHCKIALAKILQTIGWHSISSTPLEVLTDILSKYIQQISKYANDYANEFGQTEVNLDHLGLAFQEMGINAKELEEYVSYINFIPGPTPVPKFPIPKENNLNFLKPGSKEVVTRPVHINEHLPPMYPLLEGADQEEQVTVKEEITVEDTNLSSSQPFKKPQDVSVESQKIKKEDDTGSSRPTREISSVMMTTSGFLSPAREGKLPEAKAPTLPPIQENPSPLVLPPGEHVVKKKVEKRKEKINKELNKPATEEKIPKKLATPKDFVKMKQKAAIANAIVGVPQPVSASGAVTLTPIPMPIPQIVPPSSEIKINSTSAPPQKFVKDKMDKALAAAKAKTEKLNTTITPIPFKSPIPIIFPQVEKLHNEPDRKKVNIIKKISVKENKSKKEPKGSHPLIIVDEATDIVNKITHLSSDITIEPIHPIHMGKAPQMENSFYDDTYGSPPATPLTPRTPEIIMHSPPIIHNKRKSREPGSKPKRAKKDQFLDSANLMNLSLLMERPKTPETVLLQHLKQIEVERKQKQAERKQRQAQNPLLSSMGHPQLPFPFLANFGGPGLIPPQLSTPMFPFSQFGGMPNFGKNYFSHVNPIPVPPIMDPVPMTSPKINDAVEIKPVEIIPPVQKSPQPPIQVPEASSSTNPAGSPIPEDLKKQKEHKKEKKDKIKKKNKKDKDKKEKSEKKKLKELKKDGKEKVKKEKKIKKKDKLENKEVPVVENPIPKILLKVNSPSPRPDTPESAKKLNIKPIIRKDEVMEVEEKKRDPSPGGLAKISALVTGPPKQKSTLSPTVVSPQVEKPIPEESPPVAVPKTPGRPRVHQQKPKASPKPKKVEQPFKKVDEQGNEVWICPACGQQDDGRPMIGCDGCDAWYHWVCVGIQVPPDENENWYCKPCLCRKNEDLQTDKKRKRKRKEKKDH